MTAETIPGTHYPECNDRCVGDSHYLVGEGDGSLGEMPLIEPSEDDPTVIDRAPDMKENQP